jgi:hypothetical protein
VVAAVPLADGGTVDVYAEANRWSPTHISVQWMDHDGHTNWGWIPKADVRLATDSEWDMSKSRRCNQVLDRYPLGAIHNSSELRCRVGTASILWIVPTSSLAAARRALHGWTACYPRDPALQHVRTEGQLLSSPDVSRWPRAPKSGTYYSCGRRPRGV